MRFRPFRSPYSRLCVSFLLSILAGWVLLMLPGMAAPGTSLGWLDCLFTSTSAICVTGLVVRSTGNDFTLLGQAVILLMIQIGGLGFMTLSSSVLMHLRRRTTLDQYAVIHTSLGQAEGVQLPNLMARCLRIVVFVEVLGAAALFPRFNLDVPHGVPIWQYAPKALWQAVFHSISAFCNAGFSVWDESLIQYRYDPYVNIVVAGLIILGGLGFFVLADIEAWLRARRERRPHRFMFQTRLVLTISASLIVFGAILIWLSERVNPLTLASVPVYKEWMVPFFQSVTARTAGFNTVDMRDLTAFSLFVTMLLMFIGASPGSCGGGVKTTTFGVIATMALGSIGTDRQASFRNRAFGAVTVRSAITLIFVAGGLVVLGALVLAYAETGGTAFGLAGGTFFACMFEVVSAFATVGLSTGITSGLTAASKICLIALMYLGRVGPLGLVSASLRAGAEPAVQYLEEDVQIG